MTLAARVPLPAAPVESTAGYIALADAAALLSLDIDHLRRVCRDKYKAAGLARKSATGEWEIARVADPRLAGLDTREARDLRQIGEARRAGIPARLLNEAMARRDIIHRWLAADGAEAEEARRVRFINRVASDGSFKAAGLTRLASRTFRDWVDRYQREGIRTLIRRIGWKRGEESIGDRAWGMFIDIMRVPGPTITVSFAYDQVLGHIRLSQLMDDPAWAWPALRTVQARFKDRIPHAGKVLMRDGHKAFEALCVPKISRDPSDVAAGEWLVGDQRTLDVYGLVYGERQPRRVRFQLTVWMCVGSRKIVGWYIGERANSDTILSALKMAILATGTTPRKVTIDNGTPYKAVAGPARRLRKWDDFDQDRFQTAFERLGIDVNYAIPYHPWAKAIESDFRTMAQEFDAFFPSYCGGSPERRPPDAEKWTKQRIRELPQVDAFRDAYAAYVEARNARSHRGEGMGGRSPNEAFNEFFTTQPRYVDPDVLNKELCRHIGPVKVGRDGVRHDGFNYGTFDERVFLLQGREVWFALDPVQRDHIVLCEKDGTPICVANIARPIGATSEDIRGMIAHQRKCAKVVRQYAQSRDYLQKTPHQKIYDRRRAATPVESIPAKPAAEVIRVVRGDMVQPVRRLRKAAGAETLRRLADSDAAAAAVNERPLTIMDLAAAMPVKATMSSGPSARDVLEQLGERHND